MVAKTTGYALDEDLDALRCPLPFRCTNPEAKAGDILGRGALPDDVIRLRMSD